MVWLMRLPAPNTHGRFVLEALLMSAAFVPLYALWRGDTLVTALVLFPVCVLAGWGALWRLARWHED